MGLSTYRRGQKQALDHFAADQVAVHNLVDIGLVHKGVPNALRVNHRHWAAGAAV